MRTPANTWSSLAYAIVAVWLFVRTRKDISPFAWAAGAVGVCSFLFHASLTFLFEIFDYASMFLFTGLMIVLNLERLGWRCQRARLYCSLVALSLLPLSLGGQAGRVVFAIHVGLVIGTEWRCARRSWRQVDYRSYTVMMGIFAAAYVLWVMDSFRIRCHPENHFFQAHAAWHVLSSLCFVAGHQFYRQFSFFGRAT